MSLEICLSESWLICFSVLFECLTRVNWWKCLRKIREVDLQLGFKRVNWVLAASFSGVQRVRCGRCCPNDHLPGVLALELRRLRAGYLALEVLRSWAGWMSTCLTVEALVAGLEPPLTLQFKNWVPSWMTRWCGEFYQALTFVRTHPANPLTFQYIGMEGALQA